MTTAKARSKKFRFQLASIWPSFLYSLPPSATTVTADDDVPASALPAFCCWSKNSSPPASQTTADLAAGASKWSNLLTNVATTEACSFGAFCTNARMTTTASPATVSDGCKDNSNSDRIQIEAICGIIAAHRPTARIVKATNSCEDERKYACNSLNKLGAFSAVTIYVNISNFSARTSM